MDRAEWLAERRKGVGASDVPILAGFSRWKSPLHLYLDKRGEYEDRDSAPKAWGRRLEAIVADCYAEETGRTVRLPEQTISRHPQLDWVIASLDRLTEVDGQVRILECKTAALRGGEWGQPGTDEIPLAYLAQVQWQMLVTGLPRADVAVLFGGCEPAVYEVESDPGVQSHLLRIAADFWQRVLDERPPPPAWEHPETPALILRMTKVMPGITQDLPEECVGLVEAYRAIGKRIAASENEREVIRAKLMAHLGGAEWGVCPTGAKVRCREVVRRGYTVPEKRYLELRIVEPKKNHP